MSSNSTAAGLGVHIRVESVGNEDERVKIHRVHAAAFGRPDEADLVDRLRAGGHALISLVAECEGCVVGHILFSRMWIKTPRGSISAVALAPVAVLPEHQRKRIGDLLIRHGLESLRSCAEGIVIVLGHPAYYPKFSFSADKAKKLESPFPPEAFMALELCAGALDDVSGPVIYPPAFGI
jgi:putative acetyltransferase